MKRTQEFAAVIMAAVMAGSLGATTLYAADHAFGIDEINWTQEDWASIAMTNDDTVETGAVIRTEADTDSKAAGYLYRGAAVKVVDKGEEWTQVESGRVTGYVKNEFLTYGDEARGLAAHYGIQGVVANWDDVSVFSAGQGDAEVSGKVSSGAALGMVEDNGHWITVQQGADSAGFVSEDDVTRVLLVDTAVPAEGEDQADVTVTMTAADVAAAAPSENYAEEAAPAESYAEDAAPAESYAEDAAPAESYAEETAVSAESYTETASADTYTYEDTSSSSGDASVSAQSYESTQVSDDAQIQALYDAYIAAQNAAMSCSSAEDAQTKADAATAAWNAYLAACNGTAAPSGDSSAQSTVSYDTAAEETVSYTDSPASVAEEAQSYETPAETYVETDAVQEDTSAAEEAASSVSGSYGNYSDLDLLAAIIWCEAGNQPYDGMVAVGQVVMNRVKSGSFPNTISEVLNQPGQFTPASAGTLQAALAAGINDTCYAAASDALNGAAPVPGTPLYFNTHSGSYKLGAHYFS